MHNEVTGTVTVFLKWPSYTADCTVSIMFVLEALLSVKFPENVCMHHVINLMHDGHKPCD